MPLSTPQLAAEAAPAHAFAAFSFVDRIDEFEPSRRARGRFLVPAALAAFPACLVAEAVGQLAAWVAMDAVDFRGRPVAALAGETRFVAPVAPGSMLELAADIESCDDDAVSYAGWAAVDGRRVIELHDCFGPLLPTAEFDAPEALRDRLALLRGEGAPPARFRGIDALVATPAGGSADSRGAQRLPCPHRPRSSPTISRAGRCSPRRCCSMPASGWRSNLRRNCPPGQREHRCASSA